MDKVSILSSIFGNYSFVGKEYLFYCPNCNHHKKKLSINIEKNCYKCWICDMKGISIFKLIKKYATEKQKEEWKLIDENIEIADFSNIDFFFKKQEQEQEKIIHLPKEFKTLCTHKLHPVSLESRKYLKDRGLSKEDIFYYKVGYIVEGVYKDRVIFPSFDESGKINYFITRTYKSDKKKYLNVELDHREIIFNELYIDFREPIILVEGIFDAIKCGYNSIPILGSELNEKFKLFTKIVENNTDVYIALDPDAKKKEEKIIDLFLHYGIKVYKVEVSPYKDVGEMPKEIFLERLKKSEKCDNKYILKERLRRIN